MTLKTTTKDQYILKIFGLDPHSNPVACFNKSVNSNRLNDVSAIVYTQDELDAQQKTNAIDYPDEYPIVKWLCEISNIPHKYMIIAKSISEYVGEQTHLIYNSPIAYHTNNMYLHLVYTINNKPQIKPLVETFIKDMLYGLTQTNEITTLVDTIIEKYKQTYPNMIDYKSELEQWSLLLNIDASFEPTLQKKETLEYYAHLLGAGTAPIAYEKMIAYYNKHKDQLPYTSDDMYEAWRTNYQMTDFGCHRFRDTFNKLYNHDSPFVKTRLKPLSQLIDDNGYLTIYRGTDGNSTHTDDAMSWTLSKTVAYSFATAYLTDKVRHVVTATVHISNVYDQLITASSLENNELEIIIKPGSATITHTLTVPTMHELQMTLMDAPVPKSKNSPFGHVPTIAHYGIAVNKFTENLACDFESVMNEDFWMYSSHTNQQRNTQHLLMLLLLLRKLNQVKMTRTEYDALAMTTILHNIAKDDPEQTNTMQFVFDKIKNYLDKPLKRKQPGFKNLSLTNHQLSIMKWLLENTESTRDSAIKNKPQNVDITLYDLFHDAYILSTINTPLFDMRDLNMNIAPLLIPFAQYFK